MDKRQGEFLPRTRPKEVPFEEKGKFFKRTNGQLQKWIFEKKNCKL